MSIAKLRDTLDMLEDELSDIIDDESLFSERIRIENRICSICERLTYLESIA